MTKFSENVLTDLSIQKKKKKKKKERQFEESEKKGTETECPNMTIDQ